MTGVLEAVLTKGLAPVKWLDACSGAEAKQGTEVKKGGKRKLVDNAKHGG
jgi:hypothetical protein